jgi:hypothetical protein
VRPKITRSSQPVPLADRGQRAQNVAARCSIAGGIKVGPIFNDRPLRINARVARVGVDEARHAARFGRHGDCLGVWMHRGARHPGHSAHAQRRRWLGARRNAGSSGSAATKGAPAPRTA